MCAEQLEETLTRQKLLRMGFGNFAWEIPMNCSMNMSVGSLLHKAFLAPGVGASRGLGDARGR
jgi:hypothetical protein